MSEIEKMYENVGVKTLKDCKHYLRGDGNWCNDTCDIDKGQGTYSDICYLGDNNDKNDIDRLKCPYCEVKNFGYPPFTAEKQLSLIKWLARYNFMVCKNLGGWHTGINPTYDKDFGITCSERATNFGSFEYALAGFINTYWQDLTEEERNQIRSILNG